VLSRSQWVRIIIVGLMITVVTLVVEAYFEKTSPGLGITMAFVVFSLCNVAIGLAARSETETAFTKALFSDRRQVMLYGLALLLTLLPTVLGFLQRLLGLTELTGEQWMLCVALAFAVLVVEEAIEFFMRRGIRRQAPVAAYSAE
jgi:P-type Ca2+ transporter type 2C